MYKIIILILVSLSVMSKPKILRPIVEFFQAQHPQVGVVYCTTMSDIQKMENYVRQLESNQKELTVRNE